MGKWSRFFTGSVVELWHSLPWDGADSKEKIMEKNLLKFINTLLSCVLPCHGMGKGKNNGKKSV